jgi:hypothetical protein
MPACAAVTRPSAATGLALVATLVATASALAGDPWLERVRAFEPGSQAGYGAAELPRIVRRAPEGLGLNAGSTDVVSLGNDGRIVVSFDDNAVVDGEGDDLVIYENAFLSGTLVFAELAFVEVSADGKTWVEFPYDAESREGLAGQEPVLANSQNGLDPLDPASGGDRFDLADVGLDFVRFVRITDAGARIDDPGNHSFAGTKGGFDLDAAAAIHSTDLGCIAGSLTSAGAAVAGARIVLKAEGERRRRRLTDEDGSFRFCRLRPGLDYDVAAKTGGASQRVYLGGEQLRVHVDLVLD